MRIPFFAIFIIFISFSCNSLINQAYYDTAAKFNAYFLAVESINSIEEELYSSTTDNYDSLINLIYEIDTNKISGIQEKKEDIIKKLSILIQRQPESKFVYPSYALIGKIRLITLDLNQSLTTLKYVNSKSNNVIAKQMSMLYLMRLYTEKKEYSNALEVYNFLKTNSIDKTLLEEFHLFSYHLFKSIKDYSNLENELYALEKIAKKRKLLNKIYFAIGQINLIKNDIYLARTYFNKCLKNNPSFEMELNAKIFYAKTLYNENQNQIDKYFSKLIKDKKNIFQLDKIYYEKGLFDIYKNNFLSAIENFQSSIEKNESNKSLLFFSYKIIGDIYYDNLVDYKMSKIYYDSAIANINREYKDYNELKNKSEVLTDLVNNLEKIKNNDSLIYLTTLPENELNMIIEKASNQNKLKKSRENRNSNARNFVNNESKIIINSRSEGDWYFDNESMVSIGLNEFKSKWGDRELKDNWRLISKSSYNNEIIDNVEFKNNLDETNNANLEYVENDVEELKKSLPFSIEDKSKILKEIEEAFYNVGKIYIQKLNEKEKGIEFYKILIDRFNNSKFLPEIYYQLYLIGDEKEKYKNLILTSYSETEFFKLINNPNYKIDEFQELNLLKKIYGELYEKLKIEQNKYVISYVDSISEKFSSNSFFENLSLLKSIAKGKIKGNFSLQFEIKRFLVNAKLESAKNYAHSLLNSAISVHKNFIYSGLPKFKNNQDSKYFFVIFLEKNKKINISQKLKEFLNEMNYQTEIIDFELDENIVFHAITLEDIKELKKIELNFNKLLSIEESIVNANFVVGEKNLNLIFNSKNYIEFENFYNK